MASTAPRPIAWCDDFNAPLPCDHGDVGPDGRQYRYTPAAMADVDRYLAECRGDRPGARAYARQAARLRARGVRD